MGFPEGFAVIDLVLELVGSGVMATAVLFFAMVWLFFKEETYRAVTLVCAGTLVFTLISGLSRLVFLGTGLMGPAFELFRLREIFATGYLAIIPAFMAVVIHGPSRLRRANRLLALIGLAFLPLIIILAYALPRSFLADPVVLAARGVSAGTMGPVYLATQAAIGLQLLYGVALVLVDLRRWKSFGTAFSIPIGLILCGYLAISDMSKEFFGFHIDPFFFAAFSRTILGEVLLSAFLAYGFSKIFLRQARDVSRSRDALEKTEERLRTMLYRDDLTGLPNRRSFLADLRAAKEGRRRTAIILMDMGSFMEFNECFGTSAGDAILQAVARDLPAILPPGAGLYRMGGDEFSVIVPDDCGKEEGSALLLGLARNIRDRVAQGFDLGGRNHSFGLSMSVARCMGNGEAPEQALSNAYSALNEAKKDRNAICDYTDELKHEALVRISMVQRLRESLRAGAFRMVYQPIHDREGRMSSVEALLRWEPPDGEAVGPALFIPLLESSGLMPEMGELIIKLILADLGEKLAGKDPFPLLSINLSPHQLRHEGLGLSLHSIFQAAGVPPGRLQFEVTESALLDRGSVSVANLSWLRERGSAIAVDDFGTGYSNLGYLRSLPVDKLKIDQSFMRSVPGDAAAESLLSTMVDIGRTFNLSLVAEGVETVAQRDFLMDSGYEEFQGYLYSKPLGRDDFLGLLARAAIAPEAAG